MKGTSCNKSGYTACSKSNDKRTSSTVENTLAISDLVIEKAMDKVEGMLKPLKYDKNNTVFNNALTALSPDDKSNKLRTSSTGTGASEFVGSDILMKSMSTLKDNDQRVSKMIHTRSLSAPEIGEFKSSTGSTLLLKKQLREETEALITQDDIQEKLAPNQGSEAFSNLRGPIRVETSRKIWRQSNADVMIEDRVELIGCGSRNKHARLVELVPTVRQYGSKGTRRIQPFSKQTVKVGDNYIVIERTSTLKQLPLLHGEAKQFDELRTFRTREWSQKKQPSKRHIKSESAVGERRIFNLHGPLQVKSKQQISVGRNGEYSIEEFIELRADESNHDPQEELYPFKHEDAHSPNNASRTSPCQCDEHIFMGENVISVERHIHVAPTQMQTENLFSVKDSRSYVSSKTITNTSTASSASELQRSLLPLPLLNAVGMSPADSTAKSPTYKTAKSRRSFCKLSPGTEAPLREHGVATNGTLLIESSSLLRHAMRTARSPSGRSPPRGLSPRVDPLTPQRSPPGARGSSQRKSHDIHRDSQTACSPGANTSRNLALRDVQELKRHRFEVEKYKGNSQDIFTPTQPPANVIQNPVTTSDSLLFERCSSEDTRSDLYELDDRSHREAKIVRAGASSSIGSLPTEQEEVPAKKINSLHRWAQHVKSKQHSAMIKPDSKRDILSRDERSCRTARSFSVGIRPTAQIASEEGNKRPSRESALRSPNIAKQNNEILTTEELGKMRPLKQPLQWQQKQTAIEDGLMKTARGSIEFPSRDGSAGTVLPQAQPRTTSGRKNSMAIASGKGRTLDGYKFDSSVSSELQLQPTFVKMADKGELLTNARDKCKPYFDLSGWLRNLKLNSPVQVTRSQPTDDREQLKTAKESTEKSGMQGSNRKALLKTVKSKSVSKNELLRTGQEKSELFRRHESVSRMMLKSRQLTTSKETTNEQELLKTARESSLSRGSSSASQRGFRQNTSLHMVKGKLAEDIESLRTAREQNESDKPTLARWLQQTVHERMLNGGGLGKKTTERSRNYSSPFRTALISKRQAGSVRAETDQIEDHLNAARENVDRASNKEPLSRSLQAASSLLAKCVSYVTDGLPGQRTYNEVMPDHRASELGKPEFEQGADLGQKRTPSKRISHGGADEQKDDGSSEKEAHLETAKTLSFKTPPRYHRSGPSENFLMPQNEPSGAARIGSDETGASRTGNENIRSACDQSFSSSSGGSPPQSSWRFRAARIERSSSFAAPQSIAKSALDEDTRTSSERTRSNSPKSASGKNGTSGKVTSTQNTSKGIRRTVESSSSSTLHSSGSSSVTSSTPMKTLSTTRCNSGIVIASPKARLKVQEATKRELNNANAIVIESNGIHNITMVLKINVRLMTKGAYVDEKAHGLKTRRIVVGGREVYSVNSHP